MVNLKWRPGVAYMDVGDRVPTVGALGDAGAITEDFHQRKRFCTPLHNSATQPLK
jgi:hypothetical protein